MKSDGERRKFVMSRDQQSLGVFLGDGEELEGGLAGTPRAQLPAANGVGADIQIGGEKGLAGLPRAADAATSWRASFISSKMLTLNLLDMVRLPMPF